LIALEVREYNKRRGIIAIPRKDHKGLGTKIGR
jgi:hypothetical protein